MTRQIALSIATALTLLFLQHSAPAQSVRMLYQHAQNSFQQGNFEQALISFERAAQLTNLPDDYITIRVNQAAVLQQMNRFAESGDMLSEVLRIKDSYEAFVLRALAHSAQGEFPDALQDCRAALRLSDGSDYHADYNLAKVYCASAQYNKGADQYLRVTQNFPQFTNAWVECAKAYCHAGQPKSALRFIKEADRQGPRSLVVMRLYAGILVDCGDYEQARSKISLLLKEDPDDYYALQHLSRCDVREGQDYGAAIRSLQTIRARTPRLPSCNLRLAWIHATCPKSEFIDRDLAEKYWLTAQEQIKGIALVHVNVDGFRLQAAVHAIKGDYDQALISIRKAISISNNCELSERYVELLNQQRRCYENRMAYIDTTGEGLYFR